jgi:hypothetical protein
MLEMSHSAFTDNRATATIRGGAGGAIANDASTVVLDRSTFTDNEATTSLDSIPGIQGNALSSTTYNAGGAQATVSHCTFVGNLAHGDNRANGTSPHPNTGTGVGGAVGNEAIDWIYSPFRP